MFRTLSVMTAGLALCAVLARADDTKPAKTNVSAVSLSVSRKLEDKDFPYFGSTNATLRVEHPGKQILGIEQTSKVTDFKDDKNTNLLGEGFFKPNFYMSGSPSKDRTIVLVALGTSSSPAKGATKLTLKGSVVLRCGLDEKTTEAKEVEFKLPKKDDPAIKVGDFTFKVTQEKGFGFGDVGAQFSLSTTKPGIKSITVKDEDDKVVEYTPGYFPYTDFQTKETVYTFTLRKAVKKGKVSVTYYNKDEKVTVPVDLSIGLGL